MRRLNFLIGNWRKLETLSLVISIYKDFREDFEGGNAGYYKPQVHDKLVHLNFHSFKISIKMFAFPPSICNTTDFGWEVVYII